MERQAQLKNEAVTLPLKPLRAGALMLSGYRGAGTAHATCQSRRENGTQKSPGAGSCDYIKVNCPQESSSPPGDSSLRVELHGIEVTRSQLNKQNDSAL